MTLEKKAKSIGLDSVKEAVELSGTPYSTLKDWNMRGKCNRVGMTLLWALAVKKNGRIDNIKQVYRVLKVRE